jgi:hypothetical protein
MAHLKPEGTPKQLEQRRLWREAQVKSRTRADLLAEIRAAASFIGLELVQRGSQFFFVKVCAGADSGAFDRAAEEMK